MGKYDFGIVGLGVMGKNLLLNMADHGFAVVGLDLDQEKVASLEKEAAGRQIKATTSTDEFLSSIKKPRALMLLVPAGAAVDGAIASLTPFMEEGDIIVDGGNTYFTDTDRRVVELTKKNIHFFGMGISGGEKGARLGPSMMPGGNIEAYERLHPIFEAIAATVDGEPCVAYLGSGSAGHYVKMVHNGIEYGIMQLIAEAYDILKRGLQIDDDRIQEIFESWNHSELQSFLIEITAEILKKEDEIAGGKLISVISDRARSKGTGKWTSQNAMDLQAPVPVIDSAVIMRDLSTLKEERIAASKLLHWEPVEAPMQQEDIVDKLKNTLYFSMVTIYAQGMEQLHIASKAYQYGLDLENVARIWRGGCIIRAACLEDFRQAYKKDPNLSNLLLDSEISKQLMERQGDTRAIIKHAVDQGIAVPAFMASLAYFDAYRTENLPTNLIQAQRDYFGAHRYERTDREGTFHTQWDQE